MIRLMLIGPPGAGKGTQASLIAEKFGILAISTGDILRQAVSSGSALGKQVQKIIDAGQFVDDALILALVKAKIGSLEAQKGYLLDGVPRTIAQVEGLDAEQIGIDTIISIEVPDKEIIQRLASRQRADDKLEVISERLAVYRKQTLPLLEHYQQKYEQTGTPRVKQISGLGSISDIFDRICYAIKTND